MTNLDFNLTPPYVLLEDRFSIDGAGLLFTNPAEIIQTNHADAIDGALKKINDALRAGLSLAGWCSYELGYALEPHLHSLMPEDQQLPLLWFGCFDAVKRFDAAALDVFFGELAAPRPLDNVVFSWDMSSYAQRAQRILDFLQAGDVYQVNLTFPLHFRFDGDPLQLYAAMRVAQPSAHGGIIATSDIRMLSVSPELFVETRAGLATTRPMKGTAARGAQPDADIHAGLALQTDPKQRAENLMIVDLLRNDLSRICSTGSVEVPQLFAVETYPTLHTLTSTVSGRLKPGLTATDLIRSMFPCGSVTGAPKIRAMEIIRELESSPRGVYTGSIGVIAPNHDLRFNVAIRTAAIFASGEGVYGVGSGIVMDSDPLAEYEECKLKARVLTDLAEDFGLLETLRWSGTAGYLRLELHLHRLARSACLLGFSFEDATIRRQLQTLTRSFATAVDHRVRVELRRNGAVGLAFSPLAPATDMLTVAVARQQTDPGNPFLRHKTTKRDMYEMAFSEALDQGFDEALFLNRDGFITETTRGSIFVETGDVLLTPALRHGLLPGVLRCNLIEVGCAREADLRLEDIIGAKRWLVGSSLRGLREARLAPAGQMEAV